MTRTPRSIEVGVTVASTRRIASLKGQATRLRHQRDEARARQAESIASHEEHLRRCDQTIQGLQSRLDEARHRLHEVLDQRTAEREEARRVLEYALALEDAIVAHNDRRFGRKVIQPQPNAATRSAIAGLLLWKVPPRVEELADDVTLSIGGIA